MDLPIVTTPTLGESILESNDFRDSLLHGLGGDHKKIPSRFFYDAIGSELFELITELPEYYPTRCEAEVLKTHGAEIADALTDVAAIVEFGSGSSIKTEILLHQMTDLLLYVAIDVSPSALADAQKRLAQKFPDLCVKTIVADFSNRVPLPDSLQSVEKAGFFPGSTIGNFQPHEAVHLLRKFSDTLGNAGHLVIGIDLKKPSAVLNRAYNDTRGVTAKFNLNLLRRANREAAANFDLSAFRHHAAYDPDTGGIDMYLISSKAQTVTIDGQPVSFGKDEAIHTEHSHKYDLDEFKHVAAKGGWRAERVWMDDASMFAVIDLVAAA